MIKLMLFLMLITNCFCYDDSFEDIMNRYLLRGNTKLLLVKKETNSKACNLKKCDNIYKYNVNDIIVSSNLDIFYQIKINEWIDPAYVEEIKVYNQQDFRIKLNLKKELNYILYSGKIYNNENNFLELNNVFLAIDSNDNIISNVKTLNSFKIIKSNVTKYYDFNDLLMADLSLLNIINHESFNLLKGSKEFKLFTTGL